MKEIEVRHAELKDIEEIRTLAESVRYDPDHPGETGSIVYVLGSEGYSYRINNSRFAYVGVSENRVRGFLMCIDDKLLDEMSRKNRFHHGGVLHFLSQQQKPFIYGETIAIDPVFARRGVGKRIMDSLLRDMETAGIPNMHVLIRHSPHRNNPSINFCTKLGFEFTGREIVNDGDDFTWGIYSLRKD